MLQAKRGDRSLREGPPVVRKKVTRTRFKLAMCECRRQEDRMRAEALASKLAVSDANGLGSKGKRKGLIKSPKCGDKDFKHPKGSGSG